MVHWHEDGIPPQHGDVGLEALGDELLEAVGSDPMETDTYLLAALLVKSTAAVIRELRELRLALVGGAGGEPPRVP